MCLVLPVMQVDSVLTLGLCLPQQHHQLLVTKLQLEPEAVLQPQQWWRCPQLW